MRRSVMGATVAIVAAAALAGCGDSVPQVCTVIGGSNLVGVRLPAGVPERLASMHVELCQADRCEETDVRVRAPRNNHVGVARGVTLDGTTYSVDLDQRLGGGWTADDEASLTLTATDADGLEIVRHQESFTFEASYPNGKSCDHEPFVQHTAVVPWAEVVRG
jgi:hypothetical protein